MNGALGGNAWGRNQKLEVLPQMSMALDQPARCLFERFEPLLKMLEMSFEILADDGSQRGHEAGGVKAVFLLGDQVGEVRDPTTNRSEFQSLRSRRLPGLKPHALAVLEQHLGINGVGFGPPQIRSSENRAGCAD